MLAHQLGRRFADPLDLFGKHCIAEHHGFGAHQTVLRAAETHDIGVEHGCCLAEPAAERDGGIRQSGTVDVNVQAESARFG